MLTVSPDTNAYRFMLYIEKAIRSGVDYYVWPGGTIPSQEGAWAENMPAPPPRSIELCYCAGVGNLLYRLEGKRIPIAQRQSELYDGGVAAYFGSPALPQIGAGYFAGFMHDFDLETAKRWARETRSIVLIGKKYTGVPLALQGHVAFVLPSGYVLQSDPVRGLNWDVTLEQSHAVVGYTIMVHPRDHIEYPGDKVHAGGIDKTLRRF